MKYWYLKDGDILGPMPAEEIVKDNSFTEDSLVCPEDKAEQSEFWKQAQDYKEDFGVFLNVLPKAEEQAFQPEQKPEPLPQPEESKPAEEKEPEMEIPQEIALDDIEVDYSSAEEPKENKEDTNLEEAQPLQEEESSEQENSEQEEAESAEEKNPFESDRPQIAPNLEDTISSHMIAPRLDADGDTLLEDIPAKAILGEAKEEEEKENTKTSANEESVDLVASTSLPIEDTFEDTPILNIFERPQEKQKTKELKDISEDIYDTYGADKEPKEEIKIRPLPAENQEQEQKSKNNKIYLLLIAMFVLVAMALLLTLFSPDGEEAKASKSAKPANTTSKNIIKNNVDTKKTAEEELSLPKADTFALANNKASFSEERQKALAKVKKFVLSNGQTVEDYLSQKYASYQISWVADVLSGSNYYVHFNANKVRQEPVVYSFSIDLNKNEINGLNNLGMDLLIKGE